MPIRTTRRAGNAHDRVAMLDVDIPHGVPDDFIRHWINAFSSARVEFQAWVNLKLFAWNIWIGSSIPLNLLL